ncbi:MAG: YhcB family protein [Thioalkalivibrio sp.]
MSATAAWILIALALIAVGIVGYLLGRRSSPGRQHLESLEADLERQRHELSEYRQSVNAHFEKTASLFTNMAGSYRDLYDHLSESYGRLADAPAQRMLPDRPGALLEGKPGDNAPVSPSTPEPEVDTAQRPSAPQDHHNDGDDQMMGDSPHIPKDVDYEEPPQEPLKAHRDTPPTDKVDEANEQEQSAAQEPSDKPQSSDKPERDRS